MSLWSVPLRVLLFVLGSGVACLPRALEIRLGAALGRLVLACGGFKRKTAEENLRHCFPELGAAERLLLLRRNYGHYGILFFEFLHFFTPWEGHFRRYAERISRLEGYDNWKKAHDRGNGVLFVASHVGFWEMLAAAGGLAGMEPVVVTTVIKPPWLHEAITACRRSTGVRHAFHPGSARTVMQALRDGLSVAFMNDQYAPPPMGMPVTFFGVKVNTLAAIAPLARRTEAAVLPVSSFRGEDGIVRVVIEPELELGETLDDTEATTQLLAAKVESWVRLHPEQWLWIHRRFKNVTWPS